MEQMLIAGIPVEIVRKDIRNMYLAVYPPSGRVRLAVPLGLGDEVARLFAVAKLGWIRRQQRSFLEQERLSPKEFRERESHYFLGRRHLLRIRETKGRERVELHGLRHLDLHVRPGAGAERRRAVLDAWYRKELKRRIEELAERWTKMLNVRVAFWGVKQMKTKWGSCNVHERRIWLNLELVKKPIQCLEYVVVHEMVHLLEPSHNQRFQTLMSQFLPKWKQVRDELNRLPISHADWAH